MLVTTTVPKFGCEGCFSNLRREEEQRTAHYIKKHGHPPPKLVDIDPEYREYATVLDGMGITASPFLFDRNFVASTFPHLLEMAYWQNPKRNPVPITTRIGNGLKQLARLAGIGN